MVEAVQGLMSDEQGAIARRLAGWGTRLISSGQVRFVLIVCICGLIVLLLVGWLARHVYQVRFFFLVTIIGSEKVFFLTKFLGLPIAMLILII